MSTPPTTTINRNRLFLASCMALIVTSMTFAIRARLESVFGPEGIGLTLEQIGWAFTPAFWGFTLAMIFGGPLLDKIGMQRMVWVAFFTHAVGIVGTLFAYDQVSLFVATLAVGIGNGLVEAVCNPLVASMYSHNKTTMLNRFHVWFPGGIVIGSLVGYFVMDIAGLSWHLMVATLFVPLLAYGFLFVGQRFPRTERVEMGVSYGGMWRAVGTPLFLIIAFCMLLTASAELGTNQRVETILADTGVSGLLVLALVSGVMALGRLFAGPVIHRLSTPGVLLASAVVSCGGLLLLSVASGGTIFLAALVYAVGITFFWPTMLGFVAEYVPESGALGLSIMGGLGMLTITFVLPQIGSLLDEGATGGEVLRYMAILPAVLIVLFAGIYLYMRNGGRLGHPSKQEELRVEKTATSTR
ncbi:MAG: MFS transporter [Catalinimonas sp.]